MRHRDPCIECADEWGEDVKMIRPARYGDPRIPPEGVGMCLCWTHYKQARSDRCEQLLEEYEELKAEMAEDQATKTEGEVTS